MVIAGALAAVLAATTGCGSAPHSPTADRDAAVARPVSLRTSTSCAETARALGAATTASVGPYGLPGDVVAAEAVGAPGERAAAAPGDAAGGQPPEHSSTTVHEAGVDEPDIVKTDGERIVTVAGGALTVVDPARAAVTGSLPLTDGATRGAAVGLFLDGDRALVLLREYPEWELAREPGRVAGEAIAPSWRAATRLSLVDLAGPAPRLVESLRVAADYLDARMVGGTARVVLSARPTLIFPDDPHETDQAARIRRNQAVVDRAPVSAWLPGWRLERPGAADVTGRLGCDQVSFPRRFSGTTMLTILTVRPGLGLGSGRPVGLAADGDTVYASAGSLYVASSQRWPRPLPLPAGPDGGGDAETARTDLYQFDIAGAEPPRFLAGASVAGWLLNQYSMSEFDGHLRVATTLTPPWSAASRRSSQSQVTVLRREGDRLTATGSVSGLGRGEQIYAVRFRGALGYVVTFRQTDPLYVLQLADPSHPRLVGELKIPGYSAYLHPIAGDRLLGIGQEASSAGRIQGVQLSLFDVADPTRPRRVARFHQPLARSAAEFDPHAFGYWPATRTALVPISGPAIDSGPVIGSDGVVGSGGLALLAVGDREITLTGVIQQPGGAQPISRALVIGSTVWTLSADGLQGNDLSTLHRTAWLPLR